MNNQMRVKGLHYLLYNIGRMKTHKKLNVFYQNLRVDKKLYPQHDGRRIHVSLHPLSLSKI
jgi:hypothetical protein